MFAAIASPLQKLLKSEAPFEWTETSQKAFDKLRELLTTAPVLAYPCFEAGREFILETDANFDSLGAVLSQKQPKYCITELETLGLVWAVISTSGLIC